MIKIRRLLVILASTHFLSTPLYALLLEDAKAIPEYYTKNYSDSGRRALSDHAPIVFKSEEVRGEVMIWNIAGLTSTSKRNHTVHKFANIVPGAPVEQQVETIPLYLNRLQNIATVLGKQFDENKNLKFTLLQELPAQDFLPPSQETEELDEKKSLVYDVDHRESFLNELRRHGLALSTSANGRLGMVIRSEDECAFRTPAEDTLRNLNIAVVGEVISFIKRPKKWAKKLKDEVKSVVSRTSVSYDSSSKVVAVSMHVRYGTNPSVLCHTLNIQARELAKLYPESRAVLFGGDFNISKSAKKLASACAPHDISVTTTPKEESYSSKNNVLDDPNGGENPYNVDLLLKYFPSRGIDQPSRSISTKPLSISNNGSQVKPLISRAVKEGREDHEKNKKGGRQHSHLSTREVTEVKQTAGQTTKKEASRSKRISSKDVSKIQITQNEKLKLELQSKHDKEKAGLSKSQMTSQIRIDKRNATNSAFNAPKSTPSTKNQGDFKE